MHGYHNRMGSSPYLDGLTRSEAFRKECETC